MPEASSLTEAKYRAFISYSHTSDARLAAALQSSLGRIAKPWYRLRNMRVFRDKTGLSANPDLWHVIEEALTESEWFLFLACPESASSPWVQKEVEWWLKNRSAERMLIAITGGEILWSGQDFDWAKTTAVPPCCKGAFAAEPLYADFRAAKTNAKYASSDADYRGALLDLAAPLLGRPKDDLDSDDVRLHRRAEETAWFAGIFMVVLAIVAAFGLNTAHQREKIASSRALASQAAAQEEDGSLALLLSLESRRVADTVEARRALLTALQNLPHTKTFLWGHTDAVTKAVFSPDGKTILSAGWDDRIIQWNADTYAMVGKPVATPKGLVSVAFNSDGSQFVTAVGQSVVIWDTHSRQPVGAPITMNEDFVHVGFSTDQKLVAATTEAYGGRPSKVMVWDLASRKLIGTPLAGAFFAFSPDNALLALGQFGDVQFYDLQTHHLKKLLTGHEKNISAMAFSKDGTILATGAEDHTVLLWDVKSQKLLGHLPGHAAMVTALLFDPKGSALYSGDTGGTMIRWDLETMKVAATPVKNLRVAISSIFIDSSGHVKALALKKNAVVALEVNDDPAPGHRVTAPDVHSSNIAFSPDGKSLASSGEFGQILEWDTASRELHGEPISGHEKQVSSLAYCGDGKTLVSGAMDGTVIFWDTATHQALAGPVKAHHSPVWSVACSPDGKMAASGSDAQLIFWDTAIRKPLGPPATAQKDRIWTLSFSPDGEFLAAAGNSHNVAIWKAGNQTQPERILTPPTSDEQKEVTPVGVSFNPDGTLLAMSAPQKAVAIWNFKSRQLIQPVMYGHTQSVTSVAFSRDGKMLASGSEDGDIRLWDVATHEMVGTLNGGQSSIHSVVFSATDGVMASVGEEDSIIFWEASYEAWAARACQIANRNLTATEWATYMGKQAYRKTCAGV